MAGKHKCGNDPSVCKTTENHQVIIQQSHKFFKIGFSVAFQRKNHDAEKVRESKVLKKFKSRKFNSEKHKNFSRKYGVWEKNSGFRVLRTIFYYALLGNIFCY